MRDVDDVVKMASLAAYYECASLRLTPAAAARELITRYDAMTLPFMPRMLAAYTLCSAIILRIVIIVYARYARYAPLRAH